MAKINKLIEIVSSTENGLSSMGLASRKGAQAVLAAHYTHVRLTTVNSLSDLEALVARGPDLVFLGMKFIPSNPALGQHDPNKIWISQYLDDHGIIYTGSEQAAHKLELNKELAKQRVLDAGLKTARFRVVHSGQRPISADRALSYPVFIKPTNRGGGLGVDDGSMAHNFGELWSKVQSLSATLQADSLVEEYLPGREFSVGILKDIETGNYAVMPIELIAPADKSGARFLSARIKSADSEHHLAVADETLRAKLNELAIDVFHALGARDYGRIDIRLDAVGTPHFLEANLLPSLLDGYGNFPKTCLLNMDLAYKPMILQIVELALARSSVLEDNLVPDVLSAVSYNTVFEGV